MEDERCVFVLGRHSLRTLVQILYRRAERDANEVVTDGVEKVTAMRRVNIKEDTRDDNRLLLEKLLEERLDEHEDEHCERVLKHLPDRC